jgi:hypothetical protein
MLGCEFSSPIGILKLTYVLDYKKYSVEML